MRVLVVDDEELDLFINKKILSLEFDTVGFTSVADTVDWARHSNFEIALIDYYLAPGIFANHLLQELVSLKGHTFVAYAVTNYVDEQQVQELKASGFTDIIYKPLTLEVFKKKLSELPPA